MANIEVKKANFGPLGLLGFGMTTVLLNLVNSGLVQFSIVIIAMGIALGGLAQIIAGVLSFKQGNTFAGTAFTAYGFFWLSFVIIKLFGNLFPAADFLLSMGFYLLLWGIFTLFMAIGTLKHSTISKMVFWSLTLLFFLLAIGDFVAYANGSMIVTQIAGYVGILCGLFAMYDALGQIVNGELGKDILPL